MNTTIKNRCEHLADSDTFLTRDQLALRYHVTRKTAANWAARRYGPPCERVGKQPLYRLCCVKDWENRNFGFPDEDGTSGHAYARKLHR